MRDSAEVCGTVDSMPSRGGQGFLAGKDGGQKAAKVAWGQLGLDPTYNCCH